MWRQTRGVSKFCASPDILDEIEEKLRLKFGFHPRHAHLLTLFVRQQTIPATVIEPPPKVCRDPDDDPILAAAVNSGCTYLVTGDNDLLALKKCEGVSMVTPRGFAELVG
jgi:putative PIN family toxin of toxin-antitoxin system